MGGGGGELADAAGSAAASLGVGGGLLGGGDVRECSGAPLVRWPSCAHPAAAWCRSALTRASADRCCCRCCTCSCPHTTLQQWPGAPMQRGAPAACRLPPPAAELPHCACAAPSRPAACRRWYHAPAAGQKSAQAHPLQRGTGVRVFACVGGGAAAVHAQRASRGGAPTPAALQRGGVEMVGTCAKAAPAAALTLLVRAAVA